MVEHRGDIIGHAQLGHVSRSHCPYCTRIGPRQTVGDAGRRGSLPVAADLPRGVERLILEPAGDKVLRKGRLRSGRDASRIGPRR
jgi:hypothetical protein